MIRICTLIIALLTWIGALAKTGPEIQFDTLSHDFGTVHEKNGQLTYIFKYTNIGDAPLTIASVSAPCNCTEADFSPKPLAPGKAGEIKVTFTPKDMSGEFMRTISVWTNIKSSNKKKKVILKISGVVIPSQK